MSDGVNFLVFYRADDLEAAPNTGFLVEGGTPLELQQGWSYRANPAKGLRPAPGLQFWCQHSIFGTAEAHHHLALTARR
jgi:hypothetical protein